VWPVVVESIQLYTINSGVKGLTSENLLDASEERNEQKKETNANISIRQEHS
jgi:hypothetical protein